MTTRAREVEAQLRAQEKRFRDRADEHRSQMDVSPLEGFADKCKQDADSISALIAECEWRDIASAPKDGTWILAYDSGSINECKYVPHEVVKWRSCGRSGERGPGWYNSHLSKQQLVTHWRPLPAPPQPVPVGEENGETK